MEIIQTKNSDLENFPLREIYYYGPKEVSCSEQQIVKIDNYIFELLRYDIRGNGRLYVKMFNSDNRPLFEELTIILGYSWQKYILVEFYNNISTLSNKHFDFSAWTTLDTESILKRLILVADKLKKYKSESHPTQYTYAYLIFLFYENNDEKLNASSLSTEYNTLKQMKSLITWNSADYVNDGYQLSTETIYFKVLNKFVTRQIELFKKKEIIYD